MKELTKNALIVAKDCAVSYTTVFCIGDALASPIACGTIRLMTKFPKAATPIAVGGLAMIYSSQAIVGVPVLWLMAPTIKEHLDNLKASISEYRGTSRHIDQLYNAR